MDPDERTTPRSPAQIWPMISQAGARPVSWRGRLCAIARRPHLPDLFGPGKVLSVTLRGAMRHAIDGKVMTRRDLRRLHQHLIEMDVISPVSDETRAVVEREWPELAAKILPPKEPC